MQNCERFVVTICNRDESRQQRNNIVSNFLLRVNARLQCVAALFVCHASEKFPLKIDKVIARLRPIENWLNQIRIKCMQIVRISAPAIGNRRARICFQINCDLLTAVCCSILHIYLIHSFLFGFFTCCGSKYLLFIAAVIWIAGGNRDFHGSKMPFKIHFQEEKSTSKKRNENKLFFGECYAHCLR